MGGPDEAELYGATADVEGALRLEGMLGHAGLDPAELVGGEHRPEPGQAAEPIRPGEHRHPPDHPGELPHRRQPGQHRWRLRPHLADRGGARGHLDTGAEQAVAVPVVAVAVGVEEVRERRPSALAGGHDGLEHRCRQPLVPERVDQQRCAVADDEAGVRLTEPAVRLQPRPGPVGDRDEAAVESGGFAERRGLSGPRAHRFAALLAGARSSYQRL